MAPPHKTVVADEFGGSTSAGKGLKVREDCVIPALGIIGEYTGKVINCSPKKQDNLCTKSDYVYAVTIELNHDNPSSPRLKLSRNFWYPKRAKENTCAV